MIAALVMQVFALVVQATFVNSRLVLKYCCFSGCRWTDGCGEKYKTHSPMRIIPRN